jgi:hypothetical protein
MMRHSVLKGPYRITKGEALVWASPFVIHRAGRFDYFVLFTPCKIYRIIAFRLLVGFKSGSFVNPKAVGSVAENTLDAISSIPAFN